MPSIPSLTRSDIENWTDEKYYQRGETCYRGGAIYDQRRAGMTTKSKCQGTQAPFYRQEVSFNERGIQSADCSCPVGEGGHCKHVVALLLTWADNPASFQETEDRNAALERRSKTELISLIRHMIEVEPDLEDLLALPVPGADSSAHLDLKAIRRQAQQSLRDRRGDWEDGWTDTRRIVRAMQPLLAIAGDCLARKDAANAASIYQIICETILEDENALYADEKGDLDGLISDCAEKLDECLSASEDPQTRKEILQVLFNIYTEDNLKHGGIGISDSVPGTFINLATAQEKREIAGWVRQALPMGDSWSHNFHRQTLGALLLNLEADRLDDEGYLRLCRETDRLHDLVDRLLKLKRVEEAAKETRRAGDYDLLGLADLFVHHKHDSLAEQMISERATTSEDTRLLEWLRNRAEQKNDLVSALSLSERLFWKRSSLQAYEEMSKFARPLSRWEALRSEIVAKLEQQNKYSFLTEIYLTEGRVELALPAWERAKSTERYLNTRSIQIKVAKAAEKSHSREAIRLYMQVIEGLINMRGRQNYTEAAQFLKKVRALYEQLKEQSAWQTLIADLREKNRALRALQEELNKAKL